MVGVAGPEADEAATSHGTGSKITEDLRAFMLEVSDQIRGARANVTRPVAVHPVPGSSDRLDQPVSPKAGGKAVAAGVTGRMPRRTYTGRA